jgi:hypothetical protein
MPNTETAAMADVEKLFVDLEATIGRLPFTGSDEQGRALQVIELARNEIRSAQLAITPPPPASDDVEAAVQAGAEAA